MLCNVESTIIENQTFSDIRSLHRSPSGAGQTHHDENAEVIWVQNALIKNEAQQKHSQFQELIQQEFDHVSNGKTCLRKRVLKHRKQ